MTETPNKILPETSGWDAEANEHPRIKWLYRILMGLGALLGIAFGIAAYLYFTPVMISEMDEYGKYEFGVKRYEYWRHNNKIRNGNETRYNSEGQIVWQRMWKNNELVNPIYDWTNDPDNIEELVIPDLKEDCLKLSQELLFQNRHKRSAICLSHYADYFTKEADACNNDEKKKNLYTAAVESLERAAEIAEKGFFGRDLAENIRRKSSKVNMKLYKIFKEGPLEMIEFREKNYGS